MTPQWKCERWRDNEDKVTCALDGLLPHFRFHLFCHGQGSCSFLSNTCSGLTLQLCSFSAEAQYPARCLSLCRYFVDSISGCLCGDLLMVLVHFQPWSSQGGEIVMSSITRLSWRVWEFLLCEAWLREHGLTPATTPAVATRQHGLIDYAGVHLCGQAGSRHVSHLNFTGMEQDPISPAAKRKPWCFIFRTAASNGAWQVQEASHLSRPRWCSRPPLLARSLPVKWLTLKINNVISNKLFFLFLPLSISSGDRFLLAAISFNNTVE